MSSVDGSTDFASTMRTAPLQGVADDTDAVLLQWPITLGTGDRITSESVAGLRRRITYAARARHPKAQCLHAAVDDARAAFDPPGYELSGPVVRGGATRCSSCRTPTVTTDKPSRAGRLGLRTARSRVHGGNQDHYTAGVSTRRGRRRHGSLSATDPQAKEHWRQCYRGPIR